MTNVFVLLKKIFNVKFLQTLIYVTHFHLGGVSQDFFNMKKYVFAEKRLENTVLGYHPLMLEYSSYTSLLDLYFTSEFPILNKEQKSGSKKMIENVALIDENNSPHYVYFPKLVDNV